LIAHAGSSELDRPAEGPLLRMRLLAHVHTRRSSDAWITPEQIIDYARRAQIDAVIVSDHNTHLGSVECGRVAGAEGPFVPVAAEYHSTAGDIIALFLTQPIHTRDPLGIITEAHAQGGLILLPHPCRYSRLPDQVFEQCDLIETFNARTPDADNARAAEIAQALRKPVLAGADAHLRGELGLAVNEFEVPAGWDWPRVLLAGKRSFTTAKTTVRGIRTCQMIKACRSGRPILLAKGMLAWAASRRAETV